MERIQKTASLYVVTDEDGLYYERVGSALYESKEFVTLDLGDDKADFPRSEVMRLT